MLDINKLKNKKTLFKLKEYVGTNEYLISLKNKLLKDGSFSISPSTAEYIERNFHRDPLTINRVVRVTEYFGKQLQETYHTKFVPERIFIETVLGDTDKTYHVKGKIFQNQKYSPIFYIPKSQVYENLMELVIDVDVEFDNYEKLDKRKRTLYEHQKEGIKFLLSRNKCILADDMGLGKTMISIVSAIESAVNRVLIVCPSSPKINWFRELACFIPEEEISIISGKKWNPKKYTIINYDILKNFHTLVDGRKKYDENEINRDIVNENFDLVIMDECFTYNTMVTTEIGDLPIGKIVEDGMDVKILSYNIEKSLLEYKKINRWISKKTKNTLLRIKLANDIFIDCTPNHKIYVKNKGYVKAEEIRKNDELYYLSERVDEETNNEEGSLLFENLCKQRHRDEKNIRREVEAALFEESKDNRMRNMWWRKKSGTILNPKVLFNELFSQVANVTGRHFGKDKKELSEGKTFTNIERYEQKIPTYRKTIIGKDEKEQPNEEPKNSGKNGTITKRSDIFKSWWEWKNNKTTKNNTRTIRWGGKRVDNGVSNKNKGSVGRIPILTKLVQSRYWKPINKISYRNRREHPQNQEMEVLGQKENRSIRTFRVENITILERGSGQEPKYDNNGHTKVYDLEISDNHNYFSNGVLVSNCHMAKNPNSQRTKIVNEISKDINKRWLLTGTPIANRPMDYFNLLKMCESTVTTSWQYYAFRYCAAKKFKKKLKNGKVKDIWLTDGASNLEELHERTKNLMLRRKKEDHLNLPPKIVSPYYVELENMEAYNNAFKEYLEWAKSEGKKVGTGRHMVELVVLRKFLAQEKTKHTIALTEEAIENGKKIIIFTNFTHSFDILMKHFGTIAVGHNGKMSEKQKQSSVDRFQNDPNVKVFVGNLISAGSAITLTEAEVVIMNDLDFVPSNHAQAEDRAYRISQTKTVNVYYPIVVNTIDEMIYEMLQDKKRVIDTIMGDEHVQIDISQSFLSNLLGSNFPVFDESI
jgi:SNF2 family DNA or RNA helicase